MKLRMMRLAAAVPAALLALVPFSAIPADPPQANTPQKAFVRKYCASCHNASLKAAGLDLNQVNYLAMGEDAETWEKVVRKLRTGMMPPLGMPKPGHPELDSFLTATEAELDRAAMLHPDPGSPALHRLNRTEYAHVVRDLLGLDVDVSSLLPADDSSEGFDNIASVLGVSPTLIQGYVSAAMKLSRAAVGDRTLVPSRTTYRPPDGLSQDRHIEGLPLGTRGGMLVTHNFPLDAEYEFIISAATAQQQLGAQRGERAVDVDVTLGGQQVKVADTARFTIPVKAGPQAIGIALVDKQRPAGVDDIYSVYSPPGAVQNVVIIGPKNATGAGDTPSRRRLFVCQPSKPAQETPCARKILATVATRAFRQPVRETDPVMRPLMAAYQDGRASGDFEAGVQHGLARVLVDPRFLFRFEKEPAGLAEGAVYKISDLELASRLSFFLWSSIPDDQLLQVAAKGRLSKPEVLEKQVRRMLADPRAEAVVSNFGSQWLLLRDLDNVQPDVKDFDANLRTSFRRETEMLFGSVLHGDRPVVELLDADYTFVDERLARHYGISGVRGSYMRRIALPKDSPRRGLIGQGSILTATSVADRTSPVSRGKWVVENLLGVVVPAPPPGVETNLDASPTAAAPTLRKRMEMHRANATCAACHKIMDPIGFAMEPFDLTGKWRDKDGGQAIDATGSFMDGTPLNGPASLRQVLLTRSDSFVTAFTEKLMTYALGRAMRPADMLAVRTVVRGAAKDDYRMSALVLGIVRSTPFQQRSKARPRPQPGQTIAAAAANKTGGNR